MKRGTKRKLARMAGVTETHIGMILSGKRRPSWELAKRLGHITGTEPLTWLDGTPEEIREAVETAILPDETTKISACQHQKKECFGH